MAHLLRVTARRHPYGPAVVHGALMRTWAEVDARVDALAVALETHGVRQGDAVVLHAMNSADYIDAMFAVFRLGAVLVPTNARLTPEEVAAQARAAAATTCIVDGAMPDHAAAIVAALAAPALLVSIGESADPAVFDVADLIASHHGQRAAVPDVRKGDAAWFFFTSGSSGRPKAAVLTHDQLTFVINNQLCDLMPGTREDDVSLVVAPLSHGAGVHLLAQVAAGAASVLPSSQTFDPAQAWRLVAEHRVSNLFTVPTILKLLVDHPDVDAHDHSSLRYLVYAGAPAYRRDQARAMERLGDVLVQYYGLAEVTGCITVLPARLHDRPGPDGVAYGTCGFERTGMRVSVQDGQGRELPFDEVGEVCVSGPGVFAGYLDDDQANATAFRDGWFRTGDLGFLDDERFLYLTGRASDMYISGGSNIDPRSLEEKILEHPAVAEVAVVGVPDAVWGEVGVAVCVVADGRAVDEAQLLEWLKAKVARYKVPKRAYFWDALPRSGYGKVTKPLVRAELQSRGLIESLPT